MKSLKLLFLVLLFNSSISLQAQTLMPLPAHGSVYSGSVRGYWFTAPIAFTITGLRIPTDAGSTAQYIHVFKINDAVPVVYSTTSSNFTTLAYIQGAPSNVIQTVNIQVNPGDIIGILGAVGSTTSNSYSAGSSPYTSNINGNTVTLRRLLYQGAITSGPAPNYSTENSSSISRVEMYYTVTRGYNNAGVNNVTGPTPPFCSGNQTVSVRIKNSGKNIINSVKISWLVDGVPQPQVSYTTPIDTSGSVAGNMATVSLGQVTFANTPRTIKVYTTLPNNLTDTVNTDDTLVFTLRSSPKAEITAAGPTVFCTGGVVNVTLNATTGTNYSYKWKLNGNYITPAATGPSYTATVAGDYTLQVDSGACTNTSAITRVDNLAMPQPTVTPTGYVAFCDNDSVTLNANANIAGATYQWKFNNADIPGATNASYSAKIPGNYVVVTNKFSCYSTSPGLNVNQISAPTPTITINNNILSTAANYVSYQWYINGTTPISGETDYFIIPKQAGNYSVMVSNGGCSAMSPQFTVTPEMLGVMSLNDPANISIYPNPVKNILHITAPAEVNVSIVNATGSEVLKQMNAKDVDMSKLPAGVYTLKVSNKEGSVLKIEKLTKTE